MTSGQPRGSPRTSTRSSWSSGRSSRPTPSARHCGTWPRWTRPAGRADSIAAELAAAGCPRETRRGLNVGQLPPLPRSLAGTVPAACGAAADTFRAARRELADDDGRLA